MTALLLTSFEVGSLPSWLLLSGAVLTAWIIWRGGGATAIQTLQATNRVLESRVRELEKQVASNEKLIVELRGRTDVAAIIKPLLDRTAENEARAQDRFERTLLVLDLIAERLGPNGHTA